LFKTLAVFLSLCALPLAAQSNSGELRLNVIDPSGLPVKTTIHIVSEANDYQKTLATTTHGTLGLERLPYGIYRIDIRQPGFAAASASVIINSPFPVTDTIRLQLSKLNQSVTVNASSTLLDPYQPGSVNRIGSAFIQDRLSSIPGRSLQDLINSQPGWLFEGNAVLHPRGSEYQTQFVINGIPLTDNRSPSFGPEIEANDVQSVNIYTAGIPAEYGRKMGGIVEIDTIQDSQPGFHGKAALSGGSFGSAGAFAQAQYLWGNNTLGGSASGSRTDRYLNPVVPQNYSNTGTVGDFSLNFQRNLTRRDRLNLSVRHELSRYDIPNEYIQQQAGQRQTADNLETMGIASWQYIFSPRILANVRGMVRDNANDFTSNPQSTPIAVFQHNGFREAYFNSAFTIVHGRHQLKFGLDSANKFLNENLNYTIANPSQFQPGTPSGFSFRGSRPDLEQSAYAEDLIHAGRWTVSAGLRWDHYQLIVNSQAVEPRLSVARYFPSAALMFHFSYDRVFQTPSFENILLSSSTAIESINPANFLRLPVEPSRGDYYEAGLSKAFFKNLKLDANYFRRVVGNYADDDQIENTTISFPIAFRRAIIYGAEGKLYVPEWNRISGYLSYSWEVGNAWFPITGGLFLGDDDTAAVSQLSGHFPDSQDQRNTVRGRLLYQITQRLWLAAGAQFNSGLPFEFDGDPANALAEYGPRVLSRVNFARGRIYPSILADASTGVDLYESKRATMRLQADGENLNNLLNVIDFGGLFSGNAIGPPRSFGLRLTTVF
jgi:hypothetical protein